MFNLTENLVIAVTKTTSDKVNHGTLTTWYSENLEAHPVIIMVRPVSQPHLKHLSSQPVN